MFTTQVTVQNVTENLKLISICPIVSQLQCNKKLHKQPCDQPIRKLVRKLPVCMNGTWLESIN